MSETERTPLERCFDRLVEMLNLQRVITWFSRKMGRSPEYCLLPEGWISESSEGIIEFVIDGHCNYVYEHTEQENAARDYLATIEHAANALREQGFTPNNHLVIENNGNTYIVDEMIDILHAKIKQPLMDRKYPHACFQCKKPLEYRHAFNQACEKDGVYDPSMMASKEFIMNGVYEKYEFEKQFRVWWKSPIVKFMCCSCYRKATFKPIVHHVSATIDENGNCTGMTIIDSDPPEMDEEQQW